MTPFTSFDPSAVRFAADGLVPAVVQDVHDGRVLMLAYMDPEAVAATVASGEVHFHSRSRGTLWRKGETSGNVLRLIDLAIDCDGDAILVTADPAGPTCHRGTRSCFDATAPSRARRLPRHAPGLRVARNAVGHDRNRAPPNGRKAPIRRRSSMAGSTPLPERSPRKRPRCCSRRRTLRPPRPRRAPPTGAPCSARRRDR